MKFKEVKNKKPTPPMPETQAYFMTKYGEIIPADFYHIQTITEHPEKFGFTKEELQKVYKKYKETYGNEGKAREEILIHLLKEGFFRIRYIPNTGSFTIQLNKLTEKNKELIWDFLSIVRNKKINVGYNIGVNTDINVLDINGNVVLQGSVEDLPKQLFSENKYPVVKGKIVLIENYIYKK